MNNMMNKLQTNWPKERVKRLVDIRRKLQELGFTSEFSQCERRDHEEFMSKEINDKIYQISINHTQMDWYYTEIYPASGNHYPMYEQSFFKTVLEG